MLCLASSGQSGMKRLLLLRHAKSSWSDASLEDAERPLSLRGRKAAPRMGQELAARGWVPQRALVSAASRARETWALVARELPVEVETIEATALYLAAPAGILAQIRAAPAEVETLLILGHNPGLERLAQELAGPASEAAAMERLRTKFPTTALAVLEQEAEWHAWARRTARLTHCLWVKELA